MTRGNTCNPVSGVEEAPASSPKSMSLLEHFVNDEFNKFKVTKESDLSQEDIRFIANYPERHIATLSNVKLSGQANYYKVLQPTDISHKGYLARQIRDAFIQQDKKGNNCNKYYVDVNELILALISNADDIKPKDRYLIVKKMTTQGEYSLSIYSKRISCIKSPTGGAAVDALVAAEKK